MALVDAVIASSPDADGRVMVTIPGFAGDQTIGPCPVMPRGVTLPAPGDKAIIDFPSDTGLEWVVAWERPGLGSGPGPDDGDKTFVFTQSAPSATWTINHTLGKYPDVTVIDSGGNRLMTGVTYPTISQVVVTFASATTGRAVLN